MIACGFPTFYRLAQWRMEPNRDIGFAKGFAIVRDGFVMQLRARDFCLLRSRGNAVGRLGCDRLSLTEKWGCGKNRVADGLFGARRPAGTSDVGFWITTSKPE